VEGSCAPIPKRWAGIPVTVLAALLGALIYGAAMAASFSLGAESITTAMFVGLFVCGLVLPVYRAEYTFGFVVGMTVTFGGVIPLLVASVVAAVSFAVRYLVSKVGGVLHKGRAQSVERSNED